MSKKTKKFLGRLKSLILNPHLVVCYCIAWMITNGWAYAALVSANRLEIKWLASIAAAYLAILWSPFCFELIFTLIITMGLLRLLFPKDKGTLRFLKVYSRCYKMKVNRIRRKRKQRRDRLKISRRDN